MSKRKTNNETLDLAALTADERDDLLCKILDRVETQANGCYHVLGAHTSEGYAHIRYQGKLTYCHRAVIAKELTAERNYAMHVCNDRGCVNPEHIMAGTARENARHTQIMKRLPAAAVAQTQFVIGCLRADTTTLRTREELALAA